MSFEAMTWAVKQTGISAGQKLVLLLLANHANGHTGQCNPSHKLLADECCVGVSTLKSHLQALADAGLIVVRRRQNEGVDLPNQYDLKMPLPGQKLTPRGSESGWGEGSESGYKPGSYNQEENQHAPRKRGASPAGRLTAQDLKAEGVDESYAEAWLAIRKEKRLPLTAGAWALAKESAQSVGLTPAEMVRECLSRGWASFRADWWTDRPSRPAPLQPSQSGDWTRGAV